MENTSNTVVQKTETPASQESNELIKGLLDPAIKDEFSGVLTTLSAFRQQITMLQNQVRGLEKHVNKQMKTLQREAKKNKKPYRSPVVFEEDNASIYFSSPIINDEGENVGAVVIIRFIVAFFYCANHTSFLQTPRRFL